MVSTLQLCTVDDRMLPTAGLHTKANAAPAYIIISPRDAPN